MLLFERDLTIPAVTMCLAVALFLAETAFPDHREVPKAANTPALKLDALISEALDKNAGLRAAKAETEIKEAGIGPSGSYEDPMLGFEAMNYPVDNFRTHESGMTGNQISLSQKIPFPGKLGKKREAAELESEAQKAAAHARELETIKGVKLAYYDLFLAYKKYDTLTEQKALLDQLTTVTRNNYSLNKTSQAEVLNLQVESAVLIDQRLGLERQIKSKLGELNHLLGRSDHSQYVYGRPEELKKTGFDFEKHSEKSLLDRALTKSPVVKERMSLSQAADAKVSFAGKNYLPDFEFKVGYTFRKPTGMDAGTDFFSGMVGISLPLWAGSKQGQEKRGADAEKIRAEALLDEERIMLAHRIHVTYAEFEEASQRLKLYESGVLPLTRQAVVSARSAYLTGKLEYSTLLNTVTKRFAMESAAAEALTTYQSKIAELEVLIGDTLE